MNELIDFIKENIKEIAIIVITVLFLLVFINMKGINLNVQKPPSKLIQEVTVETFTNEDPDIKNMMSSSSDNFCISYLGNTPELEKACNRLTKDNCADVSCCIYGNEKCVAGNMNGPTYKTDKDGKLLTMDSFYYLGKCKGKCST